MNWRATVIEGDKRGRTLGFPTANIGIPPDRQLPGRGVYAGTATVEGRSSGPRSMSAPALRSMAGASTIEAHLLDYSGDLYGRFLAISFRAKLREEVRFDGPEDLIRQIRLDVERVREVLN